MRALLDLLLPAGCVACGRPGRVACHACAAGLLVPAAPARPDPAPAGLPPTYAVADYDAEVRTLLLAFKERAAFGLTGLLATALAASVRAAAGADCAGLVIVPVPSSRAARRQRGVDVVGDLATVARRRLAHEGLPVSVRAVARHTRSVADSAGLGAQARSDNLHGAFVVEPRAALGLAGRPVVLVDDVVTTGATLAELTRALAVAGVSVRAAAVVAATRRRRN